MKRKTFLKLTGAACAAAWAVRGCSETDLRRLFRETASAFYRLNTGPEDRSS